VDHTNQKGTLVSPGVRWFPQSPTIVRITGAGRRRGAVVAGGCGGRAVVVLIVLLLAPTVVVVVVANYLTIARL